MGGWEVVLRAKGQAELSFVEPAAVSVVKKRRHDQDYSSEWSRAYLFGKWRQLKGRTENEETILSVFPS